GDEDLNESGIAVEETESTSPVEDNEIIGTAEIKGTSGQGVACRTSPDPSASMIRVLPERMTLLVLSAPDANGWMSIVCDNQVGFAEADYLYSGGAASDFTSDKASYGNVAATGGAGLNCRSNASINSSV